MKLPKGYVPGAGVLKATAFGGIGQRLMEKQGWNKGQGLGKDKTGMVEALEVKEKKDTLGVGANGVWDWGHKFWEDAYNSAAKGIDHQGSSSSDSDTSSSSGDEDGCTKDKRVRRKSVTPAMKKPSAPTAGQQDDGKPPAKGSKRKPTKQKGSSTSSSDSDSSDSDGGGGVSVKGAMHRDGTMAGGVTAAELAIAASLAKDPWGRWGGKAGKMARIRQQEEEAAAKARQQLGMDAVGSKAGPAAAAAGQQGAGAAAVVAASVAVPKRPRIVITLTIKEDKSISHALFVPTPATGWWGSTYFISAGALEGMEEARAHTAQERQTFNEDDQANLYMKAHEAQRVGRKGLGKSTTVNIAGGKWEGTKTTFDDEAGGQAAAGAQADAGQQGNGHTAAGQEEQEGLDSNGDAAAGKAAGKRKRKSEAAACVAELQEAPGDTEAGKKKKKKKRKSDDTAAEQAEVVTAVAVCEVAAPPAVKWLKVARALIKQAPKRRLRLEKLCRQMLEHGREEGPAGTGTLKHSMSHEKLSSLLHRKAKKSKVVIQDGYVSLPQIAA